MDLSKLNVRKAANAGVEIELLHPGTREGLGIFVTVLGRDSDEYRRVLASQNRKRMAKAAKQGYRQGTLTMEEVDEDTMEILVACTKSWRDEDLGSSSIMMNGQQLACDAENVRTVYTEHGWIREQVDAAISDRANFLTP